MITEPNDFHAHATAHRLGNPRPECTVASVLSRGNDLGLRVMGVVEHLNNAAKHPLECLRALVREFGLVSSPLPCFVGAEVDILNRNGSVTCSLEQKQDLGLDYLLGAVHVSPKTISNRRDYVEEEFRRHMAVLENAPHVDVIAHPWKLGEKWDEAGASPPWSFEEVPMSYQDQLIACAAEHGKAIEVNAKNVSSLTDDAFAGFCRKIKDAGVPISIGSDAHCLCGIENAIAIATFLSGLGIDDKDLWRPRR